eukprot:TRINITY_DN11311_c0_g1_i1.p1 TRINITY_DN11311_c0_g1~~TRINITY_DN11311_c0_g1_i1.p1  ORF type:complete len:266 (+),score=30.85 TRINITY_DN11311_c0_g1_i1:200-997(+)
MHLLPQNQRYPATPSTSSSSFMSNSGIQGQTLEITVVGCTKLKDTEWISRQDPYVCIEYASTKFRTTTCTDGGKNPIFQEKFRISLIEGLRELNVSVWNSNTLTLDDFIGNGKVQLQKVLSEGFDDTAWTLQSKRGRYAGEVRLILHFAKASASKLDSGPKFSPTAPPYVAPSAPYSAPYVPPPTAAPYPQPVAYPSAYTSYPTPPPNPSAYPPSSYPPPPQPSAYPPQPYPPALYPPQPYPPPSQASPYYPSGSYPGAYPPPPY